MSSDLTVAFLGSYPPRACGIATFTRDLSDAVGRTAGALCRVSWQ